MLFEVLCLSQPAFILKSIKRSPVLPVTHVKWYYFYCEHQVCLDLILGVLCKEKRELDIFPTVALVTYCFC